MPNAHSSKASLISHERGVVYAEFLMAFTPFLMIFLGIVQLLFIGSATLVVQNAANKAVRAAAVILDDDPFYYEGEDRNILEFDVETDDESWVDQVGGLLSQTGDNAPNVQWLETNGQRTTEVPSLESQGNRRLKAIRRAAYLPLATISPQWDMVAGWFPMASLVGGSLPDRYSLRNTAIGNWPSIRLVTGFLVYNLIAAAVNFPEAPESDNILNLAEDFDGTIDYNARDQVTVRVTYMMYCGVPLVNTLMCNSLFEMTDVGNALTQLENLGDIDPGSMSLEDLSQVADDIQDAWSNITEGNPEHRRALRELSGAEHGDFIYALLLAPRTYFHVVRREATLPIQKAPYRYPTEEEDDEEDET